MALSQTEIQGKLRGLPGWELVKGKSIQKKFAFNNFKEALTFVNQVGELAEKAERAMAPSSHKSMGLSVQDLTPDQARVLGSQARQIYQGLSGAPAWLAAVREQPHQQPVYQILLAYHHTANFLAQPVDPSRGLAHLFVQFVER